MFVYLGALALERKNITSAIEKAGKLVSAIFIFLVAIGFFFGKHMSDSEGFLNF